MTFTLVQKRILVFLLIVLAAILLMVGEPEKLPPVMDASAASAGPGDHPLSGALASPGSQPISQQPEVPEFYGPQPESAPISQLLGSDDAKLVLGEGARDSHAFFESAPDRAKLLRAAAFSALQTLHCMRAGACTERVPGRAPAERLLTQSLRVMVDAANTGHDPDELFDENSLIETMRRAGEEGKVLALGLLARRAHQSAGGAPIELFEKILAEKGQFRGESAHMFYTHVGDLAERFPSLHGSLIRSLEDTWVRGDASTVLELIRHVEDLRLSEREYASSVQHLCRFSAPGQSKSHWRALKQHLERYRSTQGFLAGPDRLCRGGRLARA